MKNNLQHFREEIDLLDDAIINLLAKRMAVVKKIGRLKAKNNASPRDNKRWQEVIHRITTKAQKVYLSEGLVKKIYEEIHKSALALEKEDE